MSKIVLSLEEAKKIIKEYYETEGYTGIIDLNEVEIVFPAEEKKCPPIDPVPESDMLRSF